MASAKDKLKEYFINHVGEVISRETLREVSGNINDWQRAIRTLRQETGWDIQANHLGYILTSTTPVNEPKIRKPIDDKLRYAVLKRDNSTCQRCGANIYNTPNVKLVVDHKIPVEMGGSTTIDNLQTLCSNCNGGKQAFFTDADMDLMKEITSMSSAEKRLITFFNNYPNVVIEPIKISGVANIRDWPRVIRKIRQEKNMNIEYINPNNEYPMGGYIYKT